MTTPRDLPRVLVVTSNNFNLRGGGGITLTNLFRGWPPDRIANVHEDSTPEDRSVCANFFRLTGEEVRWSWPWSMFESRLSGRHRSEGTTAIAHGALPRKTFKRRIVSDGLPRRVTISPALERWIDAFRPELAYGFLGSIAQIRLMRAIADRWRLPIAVHIMDDWPAGLYRDGLLAPVLRRVMLSEFRAILARTTVKLAICEPMAREYERRYGGAFEVFHNALQMEKWRQVARRDWHAGRRADIRYIGSILAEAQRDAIRDVVEAVATMRAAGRQVRVSVFSPEDQARALRDWGHPDDVLAIRAAPQPELVPRLMAEADVNLLPFNFDDASARYLRFSMPTKIPAYMISGTPILVYGPRQLAAVEYAIAHRWAHVVTDRGPEQLIPHLERLIDDEAYRRELAERAQRRAEEAHEIGAVRGRFWAALADAALSRQAQAG